MLPLLPAISMPSTLARTRSCFGTKVMRQAAGVVGEEDIELVAQPCFVAGQSADEGGEQGGQQRFELDGNIAAGFADSQHAVLIDE